jgi:dimethylamine/trimethylamine dehydrogenase
MSNTHANHQLLFEPVQIGPVTAKNRFYQVPHCTGMGWQRPRMLAELRATKAEGGWGVVCTEWCSVHPSSDDLPYPNASLWDDADIRAHRLMTEKVHEHGALAGVELWLGGARPQNLFTREVGLDVSSLPNGAGHPSQTRAMTKADIKDVRRWHRDAALRAREAEFDIVYVYATHGYLLSNFLSAQTNTRIDEYGGSLENRVRLVRELIEDTRDAVGDRCAVAVRFSAEEGRDDSGEPVIGEHRDMIGMLAELPDLWDINISDYSTEMGVSRFVPEASLEPAMAYVKSLTSKPVVTVGRFTSPDTMASQIKRGITDFIGAARPSIADPFLPQKISEGRIDDIRECIGCNICYTGDGLSVPIHCTQNPTISEGWRRGWHPENIAPAASKDSVLVVGAGPAGLEAARALGQRGFKVLLAESRRELGGRVTLESRLPGLSEWIRVRDYRVQQLQKMPNCEIFLDSEMSVDDCLSVEADHIVVATGASWRRDGVGRSIVSPLTGLSGPIYTPDDIMAGARPDGEVMVFDDDHYYHASTVAECLALAGARVTYVTSASKVASWTDYTAEQSQVHRRLAASGVAVMTNQVLQGFDGATAILHCVYTGQVKQLPAESLILTTSRQPKEDLYTGLATTSQATGTSFTLARIGDCDAPGLIANAVFAGHRYARQLLADEGESLRVDKVFFDEFS